MLVIFIVIYSICVSMNVGNRNLFDFYELCIKFYNFLFLFLC